MVWVCPPHTSMNLNSSVPASSVMDLTSARAAAGSRNSSTNFIADTSFSGDLGGVEGVDLVDVVRAHLPDLVEGQSRLGLVDLGHCEPDVDQHPVPHPQPVLREQAHAGDPMSLDLKSFP